MLSISRAPNKSCVEEKISWYCVLNELPEADHQFELPLTVQPSPHHLAPSRRSSLLAADNEGEGHVDGEGV